MHICVSEEKFPQLSSCQPKKLSPPFDPLSRCWKTRCHEALRMNYWDFSLFLPFRWISVSNSFLWNCVTVSQCPEYFFFRALQTPPSYAMNNGHEFHLTLQQFPSALIVLGKQQSLHTVTEIVPPIHAGIISFIMVTMPELFLSSPSRTMKVFLEMCTDECCECDVKQKKKGAREVTSGSAAQLRKHCTYKKMKDMRRVW